MTHPSFRLKTGFLSLLAVGSILSTAQGSCNELEQETRSNSFFQPQLEVKAGYFFFSNSIMRKVYDKGGLDIQLSCSYPLWNLKRWALHAYGAIEYFQRSGTSIHGHQKTSLWSIPINIGLKGGYTIHPNMHYYCAIGPRYFYVHQHNNSLYMYKNKARNGVGFFFNTGFNYVLWDLLLFDIFGEYSYAQVHFHDRNSDVYTRNIQMGGVTFGLGVGYKF